MARKSRAKGRTAEQQYATAANWILECESKGKLRLDLSSLTKLQELPPEIGRLHALKAITLTSTRVSSLGPLSKLHGLEVLNLNETNVSDLRPIASLRKLNRLSAVHTPISDVSALRELESLEYLNLSATLVSNIEALKSLKSLAELRLDSTSVKRLHALSELPKLETLWLRNTLVDNISPVCRLKVLKHLSLTGTKIIDIRPLASLSTLKTLSLEDLEIDDIKPVAQLNKLEGISLNGTKVSDISPLTAIKSLKRLRIERTPVPDLSAVTRMRSLEGLWISGTKITAFKPLAELRSIQDSAVSSPWFGGLYFQNSELSKIKPFSDYERLGQPYCSVESINEIRRQIGLPEHVPDGYSLTPELRAEIGNDKSEQLTQRPASHSFAFEAGRIEGRAQYLAPRHPAIANDIRTEVKDKAVFLRERLETCNAPVRLRSTVGRIYDAVEVDADDLRAGVIQMRFRSLEADVAVYDDEAWRQEIPSDALAMLRDLASSVEDLLGCFPELADIEAERLGQHLKGADVPAVIKGLAAIRLTAEASDAVGDSAVAALKSGVPELQHDSEILEFEQNELAKSAALSARDRTVGYMLLVYRNFIAGAIKAGNEVSGVGSDTWNGIRQKGPDQFSDAAIAVAISGLVHALLGPTAAVAAFAVSFRPLRERAKRIGERLAAIARARSEAEGNESDGKSA